MNTMSKADLDKLDPALMKDLAKRGILRVMRNGLNPADFKYTDLPEYKKHARWCGVGITVREAERTFGIPAQTISRWAAKYPIKVIERTKRELFLDKADVAYCAEIFSKSKGARKWIFNKDLKPHVTTTRRNDRP